MPQICGYQPINGCLINKERGNLSAKKRVKEETMSVDDGIKPVLCNNGDDIDDHHVFKRKSKSSEQIQSQDSCKKSSSPTYEVTELSQCNQNGNCAENSTGKKPNGEVKTSFDSDDDKPLSFKFKQPSAAISSSVSDDSDDEMPVSSLKRPSATVKKEASDDSGDELPLGVIFSKKLKSDGTHMSSSTHSMKKEATIIDTTVDSEDDEPLSNLKSNGSNCKKRPHEDHVFKRKSKSSDQILSQATCKKSSSPTYEATELSQCNQNGICAENLTGKKPNGEVKTSFDSDDDKPLSFKLKQPSAAISSSVSDDSDDEKPVSTLKRPSAAVKKEESDNSGDELPLDVFSKKLKSDGTHMSASTHSIKKEAIIIDTTVDSEDDKPLSNLKSNGSNCKKRPHEDHVFKRKSKSSDQILSQATCKKSSSSTYEATELSQCNQNGICAENLTGKKPNGEVKTSFDSDDDKPLSFKLKQPSAAISSSVSDDSDDEKPVSTLKRPSAAVKKEVSDNSGDELPLDVFSKKLKSDGTHMSSPTHSIKKEATIIDTTVDSEDDKPLSNLKSNGSNCKKRPHEEITISTSLPSKRVKVKEKSSLEQKLNTDDDDNATIGQIMKKSVSLSNKSLSKKVTKNVTSLASGKKRKKLKKTASRKLKISKTSKVSPETGSEKKWTTFEHNGVMFPPPYKPHGIKMLYNGSPVDLTPEQEEVATMFAVMKDTDYASKPTFIENFMNDWRQILGNKHIVKKFELCDFTPIYEWHLKEKEKKKLMTTEEKKALKEDKLKQEEKYMWAIVDGVKEKVGNFRVEPPGLFRGRGEHPKMGKLKRRIHPSDITINVGKDAPIPQCPNPGERWKEVRHDNTVTWLAFWTDPINNREGKYVYLAPSSSLKGQSDKEKYEKARLLKDYIEDIRTTYTRNFSSKDPLKRQIAVATYLIDKLALRAGNEKDDDEADTVGCCTLKVENVECIPNSNKLQFDFLGKDSIRYFNTVEVEMPVYEAIEEFKSATKSDGQKKNGGDDIFDMLDTNKLNAHLRELMPGLTAKVFRTYNASITLDNMLYSETRDGTVPEKLATYQLANKEVAIICNHQRAVSKGHDTSMSRLDEKIDALKAQREEVQKDLNRVKKGKPPLQDKEGKTKKSLTPEVLESKLANFDARIKKLELDKSTREELKTVALGTSKVNYLDPRISVAWCKRNEVPIEKVFNRSLLAKFAWSMDVEPSYRF